MWRTSIFDFSSKILTNIGALVVNLCVNLENFWYHTSRRADPPLQFGTCVKILPPTQPELFKVEWASFFRFFFLYLTPGRHTGDFSDLLIGPFLSNFLCSTKWLLWKNLIGQFVRSFILNFFASITKMENHVKRHALFRHLGNTCFRRIFEVCSHWYRKWHRFEVPVYFIII